MYTHSVISQRSPNWFYFLVKPTSLQSLHTTSPVPVFAIQMYIQTAGHPERFIPMMLLFLFSFFHVPESNIYLLASPRLYFDPWKRKNSFSLPSLWKNMKAEALWLSEKWPAGCRKTIKLRQQMGRQLQNDCFPQTMATYQHIDTFKSLASWQEKC